MAIDGQTQIDGIDKSVYIINPHETILVTGANGFIGSRVVRKLLLYGFRRVRCFTKPMRNSKLLQMMIKEFRSGDIEIVEGNLLSRDDCRRAAIDVSVVFHLAAGIEKTFPGCYMDSVVATRNLLEALIEKTRIKRFVNVSSMGVYSNSDSGWNGILDETCEVETRPELRHEAYIYGKIKQDELVLDYAKKYEIPYVIVRPGDVFGPGKRKIPAKVGIDTFGIFLHLGGRGVVPLTYVDNCAEAIVLAGLKKGVDNETFNVVDDKLPTSRKFLRMYKKNVKQFKSIYIPYPLLYMLCFLWEKYSAWSEGQLPPAFNRKRCVFYWKRVKYSNEKIKSLLSWRPAVPFDEAAKLYFDYMRKSEVED